MSDRIAAGDRRATPVTFRSWRARLAWRLGETILGRLAVGSLVVVLPDGSVREFGRPGSSPHGEIRLLEERALERMLLGGETGAGEAYTAGEWTSPDIVALLRVMAVNRSEASLSLGAWQWPLRARRILAHRLRRNTKANARRNISAHYDLGNDFYRLFLDETLTYSSAVFERPDQSLADAQRAKYRRIAERAGLQPGQHVLEIGSGWGGFAMVAAAEFGCRVTSITISREQHALATERVREAGLEDLVEIRMLDYRDVTGSYDAVVSIEMLEAVGAEYLATYFETIDRVLVPGGRLSLQVITFPDVAYEPQRRGANWIQTYIFPGGLCPSLAAIERSLHGTRLIVRDVDDIAPSYVRTLHAWRTRFMDQLPAVRAQGFDEPFVRTWEYYLALSEVGFATGLVQDLQIVMEKGRGLDA